MLFDNAELVKINGKNVKSIIAKENNMTLYLNAFMKTGNLTMLSNPSIIQTTEIAELSAYLSSEEENTTVYFYEKYEPNLSLTADKSIIQSSETVDLQAKLKDEDGSLVENETVYFYIKED